MKNNSKRCPNSRDGHHEWYIGLNGDKNKCVCKKCGATTPAPGTTYQTTGIAPIADPRYYWM